MAIESSAQIGTLIRNSDVFDAKNWPGDKMNSDSLLQTVQDLFALLEQRQVEYVLVGGIALLRYVEGRNTQDLDLLMAFSSLEELPELKYTYDDIQVIHADYYGLQIDIWLTENPIFKRVQDKYSENESLLDRNIPIATVEGLLLLKLYALPYLYSRGSFSRAGIYENDIATLLYYYEPDLTALLAELAKYVSESDLAEIKTVIKDIQNRFKRFKGKSR